MQLLVGARFIDVDHYHILQRLRHFQRHIILSKVGFSIPKFSTLPCLEENLLLLLTHLF